MRASATSIETFNGKNIESQKPEGCIMRYVRRYVLKNMPKSVFGKEGVLGNIIHETMKDVLLLSLWDDRTSILKLYYKYYDSEFKKTGSEKLSESEHEQYKKKGRGILRKTIEMMKERNFLRRPLQAEKWFNIFLSKDNGFLGDGKHYLTGKMDAAFEENDDTVSVVDYKTGKWSISEEEASKNIQMIAYSFVIRKLFRKKSNLFLAYPQKRLWIPAKINVKHEEKLMVILTEMSKYDSVKNHEDLELNPSRDNCVFCELKKQCLGGISIFGDSLDG